MPAMTVAELARRLERSFAVLAAGRRGAVARHQMLRATIDWSFQLLAGPEQALARLAVFAGGATLEAAEAVSSGEGPCDTEPAVHERAGTLRPRREHGPGPSHRLCPA
jgi:predicted ATPase